MATNKGTEVGLLSAPTESGQSSSDLNVANDTNDNSHSRSTEGSREKTRK